MKGYPTPEPTMRPMSLFVIHEFVTSMILLSAIQFSAGFDFGEDAVSAPDSSEGSDEQIRASNVIGTAQ